MHSPFPIVEILRFIAISTTNSTESRVDWSRTRYPYVTELRRRGQWIGRGRIMPEQALDGVQGPPERRVASISQPMFGGESATT